MKANPQFKKDWKRDSEVARACTSVANYVSDPRNRLDHYSFYQLKHAANINDDEKLTLALQYLSSPRCRVLNQVFFFFDGDEIYEFSAAEMAEITAEGRFAHPVTGQVIDDLDKILVAFEPGAGLSAEGDH